MAQGDAASAARHSHGIQGAQGQDAPQTLHQRVALLEQQVAELQQAFMAPKTPYVAPESEPETEAPAAAPAPAPSTRRPR